MSLASFHQSKAELAPVRIKPSCILHHSIIPYPCEANVKLLELWAVVLDGIDGAAGELTATLQGYVLHIWARFSQSLQEGHNKIK